MHRFLTKCLDIVLTFVTNQYLVVLSFPVLFWCHALVCRVLLSTSSQCFSVPFPSPVLLPSLPTCSWSPRQRVCKCSLHFPSGLCQLPVSACWDVLILVTWVYFIWFVLCVCFGVCLVFFVYCDSFLVFLGLLGSCCSTLTIKARCCSPALPPVCFGPRLVSLP